MTWSQRGARGAAYLTGHHLSCLGALYEINRTTSTFAKTLDELQFSKVGFGVWVGLMNRPRSAISVVAYCEVAKVVLQVV